MRDETPDGYYVRIALCEWRNQPIAAVSYGTPPSIGTAIPSRVKSRPMIHVSEEYFPDKGQGIASVAISLWEKFRIPICEGKFSYRNGAFRPFDANDLQFIERAMAWREDDEP